MNKLKACLYLPQLSPMVALRLEYSGSSSIRCTVLDAFAFFVVRGGGAPLALERDNEVGAAVELASGRLRAAGSISIPGIAGGW